MGRDTLLTWWQERRENVLFRPAKRKNAVCYLVLIRWQNEKEEKGEERKMGRKKNYWDEYKDLGPKKSARLEIMSTRTKPLLKYKRRIRKRSYYQKSV